MVNACQTTRFNRSPVPGNFDTRQSDDGSSHDGTTGAPPNKVKKEIKIKTGWDWDGNVSKYEFKINSRAL